MPPGGRVCHNLFKRLGDAVVSCTGKSCLRKLETTLMNIQAWYNFTFDAKTADGERIYCVTAEVCLRWEDENMNKWYIEHDWPGANCSWPR
jgi:hypothetical protein